MQDYLILQTQSEWIIYFLVVALLGICGAIIFVIFGSGDLQPWAKVSANNNNTEDTSKNKENTVQTIS